MDTPLLTIAEAVEKTGRSPSTIRRLIRTVADNPTHPDRNGVEPSPGQVAIFKKKGENFTWKIRVGTLMKHFKGAPIKEKKQELKPEGGILSILQRELDLKNRQIEKQWEVIHALNDRLREGNILMGSLQQRLALPTAEAMTSSIKEAPVTEVSMEPAQAASKQEKVEATAKAPKKASKRKWLFGWFRG